MDALDENICQSIIDGLLNKFGSVTPREFLIHDQEILKKFDQAYSTVPLVDIDKVKFIKVPSNFAMGDQESDEKAAEKMKKDHSLDDGWIEEIKLATQHKRAYHERLLIENINQQKLELPRDMDKIKQLKQFYTPPFFASTFVSAGAVPPRLAWDAGRKKRGYALGSMMPPLSTDILLAGTYIESLTIFLVDELTISNLSRISFAYVIVPEKFTILLFLVIHDKTPLQ